MSNQIKNFYLHNVIDTCSIWNILSSTVFYSAVLQAKCTLICTRFVLYECLQKPRRSSTTEEEILKDRLISERNKGRLRDYHLSISDLQEVEILQSSKNLSKGELSSIAFAKRMGQAFLTDDQGARKLAAMFMENDKVQTTPQLFGWLFYEGHLIDSDKDIIIKEHTELNRPLSKYLNKMYEQSMQMKLYK
ncbi:hypothetical protein [Paenibacillus sp. 32352]|uniref:hypothetical protein n=1 Tax=Paenibacillus sp. 32352 TaxID=1969111 RepID=UPI0009AE935F|nr:hypothetical protein [Paenibacillus sp. 32352]